MACVPSPAATLNLPLYSPPWRNGGAAIKPTCWWFPITGFRRSGNPWMLRMNSSPPVCPLIANSRRRRRAATSWLMAWEAACFYTLPDMMKQRSAASWTCWKAVRSPERFSHGRRDCRGRFPLNLAHINSPNAPDVVVALRWSDDKNAVGVPGTVVSDGGRKAGQGTHATFSRFDVHNTFVAAGPDFRAGATNDTPTSNADIAPTAAWILGLPVSSPMDGRVIKEALESSSPTVLAPPKTERLEAGREFESRHWQQYLQATLYDGETYLDEANGSSTSQKP